MAVLYGTKTSNKNKEPYKSVPDIQPSKSHRGGVFLDIKNLIGIENPDAWNQIWMTVTITPSRK
jgi:hypothetical protein